MKFPKPASPAIPVPRGRARLPDRLFSVPQAAEQLGISDKGVRRAIQRGDLAAHRIGRLLRISDEDLAAFVAVRRMRAYRPATSSYVHVLRHARASAASVLPIIPWYTSARTATPVHT